MHHPLYTSFKMWIVSGGGLAISFADVESLLRIVALIASISGTVYVFYRDNKKNK